MLLQGTYAFVLDNGSMGTLTIEGTNVTEITTRGTTQKDFTPQMPEVGYDIKGPTGIINLKTGTGVQSFQWVTHDGGNTVYLATLAGSDNFLIQGKLLKMPGA